MYPAIAALVVLAAVLTAGAVAVARAQRQSRESLHREAGWNDRVKVFQARRRAHHIARERLRQLQQQKGSNSAA